jgi:dienelactone hydrolase
MKTQTVDYHHGDTVLEGYLAYDDSARDKRPGILVVPDFAGLNAFARKRCDMLADLGYVAFAADVYGKSVRPTGHQEALQEARKYRSDRALLRARLAAGLDVLRRTQTVDASRIGVVGYCFGGMAALELARSGADVSGTICFHGNLDTPNPQDAKNIRGAILVLNGAADPMVPPDTITAFEKEMREANVDWQFVNYGGALHAYTTWDVETDLAKGVGYDEKTDRRSWIAMHEFFKEIFARE